LCCKLEHKIYSEKFLKSGTLFILFFSVTGLKYLTHMEGIAVQESLGVTGFSRKERNQELQKSEIKEFKFFWEKRVQKGLIKIKLRNHFRYLDVHGRNMRIEMDVKEITSDNAQFV
jgi:hypothetical protein